MTVAERATNLRGRATRCLLVVAVATMALAAIGGARRPAGADTWDAHPPTVTCEATTPLTGPVGTTFTFQATATDPTPTPPLGFDQPVVHFTVGYGYPGYTGTHTPPPRRRSGRRSRS